MEWIFDELKYKVPFYCYKQRWNGMFRFEEEQKKRQSSRGAPESEQVETVIFQIKLGIKFK